LYELMKKLGLKKKRNSGSAVDEAELALPRWSHMYE
jgi:hypothetical protein